MDSYFDIFSHRVRRIIMNIFYDFPVVIDKIVERYMYRFIYVYREMCVTWRKEESFFLF